MLFDFGRASLAPNIEAFAAVSSRATIELADLGGSSSMVPNGQMPHRFSLYCELFRVPGIGESQFQAILHTMLPCRSLFVVSSVWPENPNLVLVAHKRGYPNWWVGGFAVN